jgi:hypothetical protein
MMGVTGSEGRTSALILPEGKVNACGTGGKGTLRVSAACPPLPSYPSMLSGSA